ncbi:MAG: hypothetical protein JWP15_389, partial [Alphaproteobacteria bacterium]|nr:hypothetical protein [Alphaproteobacteria bacterium]
AMGATLAFFGGAVPAPSRISALFAMVLAITAAIIATIQALARSRHPSRAPAGESEAAVPSVEPAAIPEPIASGNDEPPVAAPAGPRLLDRLPARLRGAELHALQAEDHYLRVHTSAGSDLILLRMADALGELDGVAGARTHRSWWVARSAIDSVRRGNGRAELTLKGDIVAPVSRSYLPALQQAGWFG